MIEKSPPESAAEQSPDLDTTTSATLEMPDAVIHNDSGHESSVSSTEGPSTPEEESHRIGDAESQKKMEKVQQSSTSLDNKYTRVKIVIPGGEQIDIQINDTDIIQELYHILLERDSTCHRTCFKLYYGDTPLDPFTEIHNIPNIKDRAIFRVVEEPYTIREARTHIRHLREIIRSQDISDAINGVEFASLTCISLITQPYDEKQRKSSKGNLSPFGLIAPDSLPPDWLMPGSKEVPLKPMLPLNNIDNNGILQPSQINALKQISFSAFNPPPGPQKMKGDILYLFVDTVEERRFHITCCTRGFYVNSTVAEKFKPEILKSSTGGRIYHSLFDLLSEISPHFKKTLAQMFKIRNDQLLIERLPTPYQIYQWIVPMVENSQDQIRADEQIQPHRLGLEDQMPGQVRDWNEELQATHDMSQGTFTERICRDRARFKVHADFLAACTRGAIAVVDGSVHTINPMDEPKMQMYIWNNIFFSLGYDVKDHYKEVGGDAASHASYSADLAAVQAYSQIDDPKLHTSGMAVIDFKGIRLMAQSIIPGILERDQQEAVVYGSFDSGKTVLSDEEYQELLEKSARILKIAPHRVWNGKEGDESQFVKLYSSFESKGITGNDRRHYLMDLLRTFPPDINFMEEAEPTQKCKAEGFPRKFRHKLSYLRPELIDSFVDFKINQSNEAVIKDTEQTDAAVGNSENLEEVNGEKNSKEEVDIRLNPDCFSTAIKHAPEEDLEAQRKLVAEAAEYILTDQIPNFVRDCFHNAISPIDGVALVEIFHARGINVRYIGKLIETIQSNSRLDYLTKIAKVEVLCRCTRHIFRDFLQTVETHQLGAATAHFLNCLIGSGKGVVLSASQELTATDSNDSPPNSNKISTKKRRKPKMTDKNLPFDNNNNGIGSKSKTVSWTKFTQEGLWKSICEDSQLNFGLPIPSTCCDEFIEWSEGAQRSTIVRRFCILNGIQIVLKNYQFDSPKVKCQSPFSEDDIFNFVPLVKRVNPRSQAAYNLYLNALIKMQQGFPRTGYDLMQQAHSLMSSVYGPLHPDLALCLRFMARMAYAMNNLSDAMTQQHKALVISERCNGIDHHETITDYINLAHFTAVTFCIPSALKLLYHARHLLLLAHGEDHPQIGQIDANIGIILYILQEYETALKFLDNALELYQKYGASVKVALLHHVIARTHSCRGDFRTALTFEKETFNIYSRIFGTEHEKTLLSNECLRHLTKQAVSLQKHMNQATQGHQKNSKQLMPNFQVQSPTLQNVVELLNAFNNFVFWKIHVQTN